MSPRFPTPNRPWRIILLVVALAAVAAGIVYVLTTRGLPGGIAVIPTPTPLATATPSLPQPDNQQDPRLVPVPFPVREEPRQGAPDSVHPSAPAGPAENALALVVVSMLLGVVGLWRTSLHKPS